MAPASGVVLTKFTGREDSCGRYPTPGFPA